MSVVSVVLVSVIVTALILAVAAGVARKLVSNALRRSEARSTERLRAVEARLQEQLRRNEGAVREQAAQAGKDAEASRRAEENLLEVAKGLTTESIQFDERLKALERRAS